LMLDKASHLKPQTSNPFRAANVRRCYKKKNPANG